MTSAELATWRALVDTTAELRRVLGAELQGSVDPNGSAMIQLDNIAGANLHGCSVPRGAAAALRVSGERSADVRIGENDFGDAKQATDLGHGVDPDAVRVAPNR